jgi:hypothetical protein
MARSFAVILAAAVSLSAAGNTQSSETLSQLRAALGGEDALGAVARVRIVGKIQQNIGDGSLEIWAALPDRFVQEIITKISLAPRPPLQGPTTADQKAAFDARASVDNANKTVIHDSREDATAPQLSVRGFDRGEPLPGSYRPSWKTTYPDLARRQLEAGQRAFRRVFLPLLAGTHTARVTETAKRSLTFVDADGGVWRITLDDQHRPLTLLWSVQPRVTGATAEMFSSTFSDYRVVQGGLTWPHRIVTTVDGQPYEDLAVKRYEINGKVSNIYFRK